MKGLNMFCKVLLCFVVVPLNTWNLIIEIRHAAFPSRRAMWHWKSIKWFKCRSIPSERRPSLRSRSTERIIKMFLPTERGHCIESPCNGDVTPTGRKVRSSDRTTGFLLLKLVQHNRAAALWRWDEGSQANESNIAHKRRKEEKKRKPTGVWNERRSRECRCTASRRRATTMNVHAGGHRTKLSLFVFTPSSTPASPFSIHFIL